MSVQIVWRTLTGTRMSGSTCATTLMMPPRGFPRIPLKPSYIRNCLLLEVVITGTAMEYWMCRLSRSSFGTLIYGRFASLRGGCGNVSTNINDTKFEANTWTVNDIKGYGKA